MQIKIIAFTASFLYHCLHIYNFLLFIAPFPLMFPNKFPPSSEAFWTAVMTLKTYDCLCKAINCPLLFGVDISGAYAFVVLDYILTYLKYLSKDGYITYM